MARAILSKGVRWKLWPRSLERQKLLASFELNGARQMEEKEVEAALEPVEELISLGSLAEGIVLTAM